MTKRWIYGINPVFEALTTKQHIQAVYITKGWKRDRAELLSLAGRAKVNVEEAGKEFFDKFHGQTHQGICALLSEKQRLFSVEELFQSAVNPLFVILDGIEDPRNFGAILRTSEVASASGVIFQTHRSAGLSPLVDKTSSGASFYIPMATVPNIKNSMRYLKDNGVTVYGADAASEHSLWSVDLTGPAAFVFGSEGTGLRKTVSEQCDMLIKIPVFGSVSSLNVSVSAGIFLFECKRQRECLRAGT
ncbi:MAG: 23S rRNA (guanosine(2251)-2'-O)-methyltransferase RlmB [Nitrospirae bacterium]|nr:23S rRNA (guanosine(2251)-2'-O)-methyltransferase RlmB [Nitrospirota bacterium]